MTHCSSESTGRASPVSALHRVSTDIETTCIAPAASNAGDDRNRRLSAVAAGDGAVTEGTSGHRAAVDAIPLLDQHFIQAKDAEPPLVTESLGPVPLGDLPVASDLDKQQGMARAL